MKEDAGDERFRWKDESDLGRVGSCDLGHGKVGRQGTDLASECFRLPIVSD